MRKESVFILLSCWGVGECYLDVIAFRGCYFLSHATDGALFDLLFCFHLML